MSMKEGTLVKAGVSLAVVAATTAYLVHRSHKDESSRNKNDFPIEYDHPYLPLAMRLIAKLPKSIRRSLALKTSLPKPPRDAYDVLGEDNPAAPDPYDIVEIQKGKIWRVRYHSLVDPKLFEVIKSISGKDMTDTDAVLENVPPELKDLVAEDVRRAKKKMAMTEKELVENRYLGSLDTLVARLDTKDSESGKHGLLVYNPCRMRPRVVNFLNDIGTVSYIVSGSSSHTNQFVQAAEAFPHAKLVCAEVAEMKCKAAGMRKADFIYTQQKDLNALNAELAEGGAELHFVRGDTLTHAALVLVHGHVFECDLVYGRHCKTRVSATTKDMFEDKSSNKSSDLRLFYYALSANEASFNGCLPVYRYMAMDTSSPFSKMLLDEPASDSCAIMASSLRKILRLKFDAALMVHSGHGRAIPADEFKKDMNENWSWLDSESLL